MSSFQKITLQGEGLRKFAASTKGSQTAVSHSHSHWSSNIANQKKVKDRSFPHPQEPHHNTFVDDHVFIYLSA
uniref:Uncharacterized protein n=1 Tax=Lotus japonicus TaxID=34305 RepID=I3S989_LOTJA|nr:unknown [Lotus japonicus]